MFSVTTAHAQMFRSSGYGTHFTRSVLCDFHNKYCRHQQYSTKAVNYYDVLEVTPKSSQRHIKSAYYRLSKRYHPDVNKDASAREKFAQIAEAYEVLGNIAQRRLYDQGMFRRDGTGEAPFQYEAFVNRKGYTKRGAPPTGRSHIYNFDEFYRQHYGESINRKRQSTRARVEMEQQTKEMQQKQRRLFIGYVLALGGLVSALLWKKKL